MARSGDRIEVNYQTLNEIARQFDGELNANQQLLSQTRAKMDMLLQSVWQGTAADGFLNEMQSNVLPGYDRMIKALDETVRITNQIIQTFQQAEADAAGAFNRQDQFGAGGVGGKAGELSPIAIEALDLYKKANGIYDAYKDGFKFMEKLLGETKDEIDQTKFFGDGWLKVADVGATIGKDFLDPQLATIQQKVSATLVDSGFDIFKSLINKPIAAAAGEAAAGAMATSLAPLTATGLAAIATGIGAPEGALILTGVGIATVVSGGVAYFGTDWLMGQGEDIVFEKTGGRNAAIQYLTPVVNEAGQAIGAAWNGLTDYASNLFVSAASSVSTPVY